ncbi:glycerol-3-phosphate 1-O-acyltransferase PlsY [uncultured Lentibacter sp.]|uniref:glycerol-3-phosphate 1-O-acyltransferase PlsY n=1 Tax=uncultured Lentibacter sp. TaxID=1659309 RepID=UPI002635AABA|nr:glycerol-3-phosphate 1-O-acyltransferase PlsY [uncultured Lentibacter sp.]MCW1956562.1 glycerol-3-phosphate 1-O-acyltransferase PlsY [Roseobacter sp.]
MPLIEHSAPLFALWALIGYLFGSVPFGVLVSRAMNLGDLRAIGSGNIGATNVLRTGNKTAALLTLLLDGSKAAVVVLLARAFAGEDLAQLAGLMAFLGHCFPVWLRFKGGKGVATFIGLLLALNWAVGLAVCATWLLAFALWRISSLAAVTAASASTIWMTALGAQPLLLLGITLTVLVFFTHRSNIERLRAGTEPKFGGKK